MWSESPMKKGEPIISNTWMDTLHICGQFAKYYLRFSCHGVKWTGEDSHFCIFDLGDITFNCPSEDHAMNYFRGIYSWALDISHTDCNSLKDKFQRISKVRDYNNDPPLQSELQYLCKHQVLKKWLVEMYNSKPYSNWDWGQNHQH